MTVARRHLTTALSDVENLLNFHEQIGGIAQGRRSISLSSLNKSGLVLLCAAWETYVESVIIETAASQIRHAISPEELPRSIFRLITSHVRSDRNESVWMGLAGRGWKDVANGVVAERAKALNTPKPGPIRELVKVTVGIPDITDDWNWARNPYDRVIDRLNNFVSLRGDVAHGKQLDRTVTKRDLTYSVDLVLRLADKVESRMQRAAIRARRRRG